MLQKHTYESYLKKLTDAANLKSFVKHLLEMA